MKVAIVYDSSTGKTMQAARDMAAIVRDAGHKCTVYPVKEADPAEVAAADAILIGSWTHGLVFFFQRATYATLDFIESLGPLNGKPAAVFCTYAVATGKMLPKMTERLSASGANVTGQFRSRGPTAGKGFREWVKTLGDNDQNRGRSESKRS